MTSMLTKLWAKLNKRKTSTHSGGTDVCNSSTSNASRHANTTTNSRSEITPSSPPGAHPEAAEMIAGRLDDKSNTSIDQVAPSRGARADTVPTVGYNYERIQYKGMSLIVLDFSGQSKHRNLWQEFYNSVDGIVFVIDSSDLIRFVVVRDELETMLSHPYFGTLADNFWTGTILLPMSPSEASLLAPKQLTLDQGRLVQSPLEKWVLANTRSDASLLNTPVRSDKGRRALSASELGRRRQIPILFLANKADLANSVDTDVIVKALNLNQLSVERHPWFIQATSVNFNQGVAEGFDWLVSQLVKS